jgi:hypothetical protein
MKATALRERHARGENVTDKARTLGQPLDDWIATGERQGKTENTLLSYRGLCTNHLKPRWAQWMYRSFAPGPFNPCLTNWLISSHRQPCDR